MRIVAGDFPFSLAATYCGHRVESLGVRTGVMSGESMLNDDWALYFARDSSKCPESISSSISRAFMSASFRFVGVSDKPIET
jgi:hypothetical protein